MSGKQPAAEDPGSSASSRETQNGTHNPAPTLRPENQRMLAWIQARRDTPLTDEEITVLSDFEEFLRENRFSLSSSSDK